MSDATEEPKLHFFRTTPADILTRPPLASSLQSFESCLFFIALARYPHAFAACTFAIESVIKAAFAVPSSGGDNLQRLVDRARDSLPGLRAFPQEDVDRLRQGRNRIVHYGFSPKDDSLTAALMLESGVPFLAAAYQGFFDFDLYDGLLIEFAEQLRNALSVFERFKKEAHLDPSLCFIVLGHLIRWSVRDSLMANWEREAAEDADVHGQKFDVVERRKSEVERALDPAWAFDCPICDGIGSLIGKIVEADLEKRRVSLSRAICAECGLVIPKNTPFLADAICRDQIDEHREHILHEFGVA